MIGENMDSNKKVLLVEDEDYIRELYKRQLDLNGFVTDAFGLGKDGMAAASQSHYDLILLDIMLPDINGLQILQQLKQSEMSKSTPVVLLTNLGQDPVIKQGFELGADGYLVKAAYTPDQIVQEVKNIMLKKQPAQEPTQVQPAMSASSPLSQSSTPGSAPTQQPSPAVTDPQSLPSDPTTTLPEEKAQQ